MATIDSSGRWEGKRRLYLRGHGNIRKRLLIHACGYNLGVLMRAVTGIGTPRSLQGQGRHPAKPLISRIPVLERVVWGVLSAFRGVWRRIWPKYPETGQAHS